MNNFSNIVNNFKNQRILLVGDLMLDEHIFGDVERISPEAPVPVLLVERVSFVPGGAANAAHNIKSLGAGVVLAGVVGPEEKGKVLKKLLKEKGIEVEGIIIDNTRKTTVKTKAIARQQHIVRIDSEDKKPISAEIENKLLDFIRKEIKNVNSILISDYAKGVVTSRLCQEIIQIARDNKKLCLIDPKGKDYSKYRGCSIITPNEKELALALNIEIKDEGRFLQAGKMLLSHVMPDSVLVTQGKNGMTLFENTGKTNHVPARTVKVKDVSGAGDTAIAVFALALSSGSNTEQAMLIATHACAIGISKMGAAVVSPKELEESLKNV